ncbi:MAG: NHL repeat-containing protein [Planctomycetota bacterium]|jgi:hypothetical protein
MLRTIALCTLIASFLFFGGCFSAPALIQAIEDISEDDPAPPPIVDLSGEEPLVFVSDDSTLMLRRVDSQDWTDFGPAGTRDVAAGDRNLFVVKATVVLRKGNTVNSLLGAAPAGVTYHHVAYDGAGRVVVAGRDGDDAWLYQQNTVGLGGFSFAIGTDIVTGLAAIDGEAFVVIGGELRVFSVLTGTERALDRSVPAAAVTVDRDGMLLVSLGRSVFRIDPDNGDELSNDDLGLPADIVDLAVGPDNGHRFVTTGADRIYELDGDGNLVNEISDFALFGARGITATKAGRID